MMTLTLCESTLGFFCIQTTDEYGALVALAYLDGGSFGVRSHTWEALEEVGEQEDADDTDAFWQAVNESLRWVLANRGAKAAWEEMLGAYHGSMSLRECAHAFRQMRKEVPCES